MQNWHFSACLGTFFPQKSDTRPQKSEESQKSEALSLIIPS